MRAAAKRSLSALLLCLAVHGCAEGWAADADEAGDWLPTAAVDLKRVIVLLRTCQPRRASGYNTVWASGEDGGDEPIHCAFGASDAPLAEIRGRLLRNQVLGVSYAPSGSNTTPVASASFILSRSGIVTSGTLTEVEYSAKPLACAASTEGDSFQVTHRPLTGAPCRWFWVQSKN